MYYLTKRKLPQCAPPHFVRIDQDEYFWQLKGFDNDTTAQNLENEEFVTAEDEEPLLTKQKQQDLLFLY